MKQLFLTALLLSCSQTPKKATTAPVTVNVQETEIEACVEYKKNVLDKASVEKNGKHVFTKDVKQARAYLSAFDVKKGLLEAKASLAGNVLQQCTVASIKEFETASRRLHRCYLTMSELNFFQGLAEGLRVNPWPTDLKLEGKKVALDYVGSFVEGRHPLLGRLVALSVLDELSVNKIVDEKLHGEIKKEINNAQVFVEGLRGRLTKDPTLSCEGVDIIRDELEYSDKIGQKIKEFLSKI